MNFKEEKEIEVKVERRYYTTKKNIILLTLNELSKQNSLYETEIKCTLQNDDNFDSNLADVYNFEEDKIFNSFEKPNVVLTMTFFNGELVSYDIQACYIL